VNLNIACKSYFHILRPFVFAKVISAVAGFGVEITFSNEDETKELTDIVIDIDASSSFYYTGATAYKDSIGAGGFGDTTLDLMYTGTGNKLSLIIRYKIDGTQVTETEEIYIADVSPVGSEPAKPSTDKYEPKLVVENAGIVQTINAGRSGKLKFKVKNDSNYQAKNLKLTLTMDDLNTAPKVLQDFVLRQTVSSFNANETKEIVFDVSPLPSAPKGVYKFTLSFSFENAFSDQFSMTVPFFVRVENDNVKPLLAVNDVSVRKSATNPDVIVLDLKIKNLGNLRADDVKVTLGGLRSDGFTLYNTTDVRYIDLIYGNGSTTVSYDLLPPVSGAAGSNELTVSFEYMDSAGNKYSEQNKIFVPVGEGEGTRPNITFEQIAAPNEAVGVGREFSVSFNLKNNGGASARNVKVTMNTDAGIVIRSMNPVYFTGIDGSKSEKVTYKLFASEDAATKNYPISLNVEYEDVLGNRYNATQYIGVFVENDAGKTVPRIIIDNYTIDPFPVNAGDEFSLKMSFLNTNKTVDVSNIKVTVLSEDGTFTPTESGNTFYIESIPRTRNVERELVLQAKPDAEQKSYMLTVNFEYEDEKGNPYTSKESISVRVIQSPRLVTSDISMMTDTFVGQPVSVYLDFYNMGKSTLYNLMVSVEGDFEGQGLSYYVGNFEPGRTDYFDATFIPMNPGMQKGAILFAFEDANGKTTEIRKEFEINVMEMMMPEPSFDDPGMFPGVDMPGMPGMDGGSPKVSIWIYIGIGAAVVIAAVVAVVILRKRAIRRKELSLDD